MTYFSAEQPRFMSKSESDKLFQAQLSKDGKILEVVYDGTPDTDEDDEDGDY